MDTVEITDLLPHRYPFLFVDRVVSLEPGQRITALKNVTTNEPFFSGHFPSRPLMPGVLICEAVVQAGGIVASSTFPKENKRSVAMLTGLDRVRFRHPVLPGDQLRMEVEVIRRRDPFWKMRGVAAVEGKIVAELEFTVMLQVEFHSEDRA
ncbi:MAG: 3-hydroxyacyl-ACP dehydratase FabZ [Candidatus Binatia bacterium]|nr:3-hydroxyacyl-ACP dehydratase FabZ [Candidatus Binatia bacterium]